MNSNPFCIVNIGLTDYSQALDLQQRIVSQKIQNKIKENIILLLEHPSVFTLGKTGGRKNIKVDEKFLESKKISVIQTKRGGSITFHGPGQLVVYPIIDFNRTGIGVTDFVYQLEEIMIQTSMDIGVKASRNKMNRGVWVKNKKLGSIGLSIIKGISCHGFALNVNLKLEPFSWINPCGMEMISMTSLERESRKKTPETIIYMESVRNKMVSHLEKLFKSI